MPNERSIDIDSSNDYKLAKYYLKNECFILRICKGKI